MYIIQNGKIEFLALFANSKLFPYHHNQTFIFDLPPKLYKIQTIQHKKAFKILMSQLSRIVCIHDTRHMYNICMENAKDI